MKRNEHKRKGNAYGPRYTRTGLAQALRRACRKAGVAPFTAYQLRHLVGAELRQEYGLEYVRAVLGHSFAAMSDHYSRAADQALAVRVAASRG